VCSKSRPNCVIVEHEINTCNLKKSIIEVQFTIAKTYLHVLNLKTAHSQLHLSRVGFFNEKNSSREINWKVLFMIEILRNVRPARKSVKLRLTIILSFLMSILRLMLLHEN